MEQTGGRKRLTFKCTIVVQRQKRKKEYEMTRKTTFLIGLSLWLTVMCALTAVNAANDAIEDGIKVEVTGTLRTGLMAIGGETTGTVIISSGVTWELDLGRSPKLQKMVSELAGEKVTVSGIYQRRRGVEIPQREIVTVTALSAARPKQNTNK